MLGRDLVDRWLPALEVVGGVDVRYIPWRAETEIDDLQHFDIGLMPLEDNEWTRYKCGLKILQYMAIGIPGVVSPVGVNSQIVQHGENGFLATSESEWTEHLECLLNDIELRKKIGRAGRQTVENCYSVEANVSRLEEVFLRCANRDR